MAGVQAHNPYSYNYKILGDIRTAGETGVGYFKSFLSKYIPGGGFIADHLTSFFIIFFIFAIIYLAINANVYAKGMLRPKPTWNDIMEDATYIHHKKAALIQQPFTSIRRIPSTRSFTLSLWFLQGYNPSKDKQLLFAKNTSNDIPFCEFGYPTISVKGTSLFLRVATDEVEIPQIPIGSWNHVLVCKDVNTVEVYINHKLVHTKVMQEYNIDLSNDAMTVGSPVFVMTNRMCPDRMADFTGYVWSPFLLPRGLTMYEAGVVYSRKPPTLSKSTLKQLDIPDICPGV